MKLRVHHLLCSALFKGKGYSEAFTEHMRTVAGILFPEPDREESGKDTDIILTIQSDLICGECPNLKDNACCLDDNNVVAKDAKLAEALGLECDMVYRRKDLLRYVAGALSEDIFETSCHKCRWYEEGLCSYAGLREKYDNFN